MTNKNQNQAPESSKANVCGCSCQPCSNCESLQAYQDKLEKEKQEFIAKLDKNPIPEHGLAVGDVVTFTNDYGIAFMDKVITGFATEHNNFKDRFIYLDWHSYWFPVKLHQIKKQLP